MGNDLNTIAMIAFSTRNRVRLLLILSIFAMLLSITSCFFAAYAIRYGFIGENPHLEHLTADKITVKHFESDSLHADFIVANELISTKQELRQDGKAFMTINKSGIIIYNPVNNKNTEITSEKVKADILSSNGLIANNIVIVNNEANVLGIINKDGYSLYNKDGDIVIKLGNDPRSISFLDDKGTVRAALGETKLLRDDGTEMKTPASSLVLLNDQNRVILQLPVR
jgi:hypothetical protein